MIKIKLKPHTITTLFFLSLNIPNLTYAASPFVIDSKPEEIETAISLDGSQFPSSQNLTIEMPFLNSTFNDVRVIKFPNRAGKATINDAGEVNDAIAQDGIYTITFNNQSTADAVIKKLQAREGFSLPVYRDRARAGFAQSSLVDSSIIAGNKTAYGYSGSMSGGNPDNIDPSRELFITNVSVVDDPTRTYDSCISAGNPTGEWTFSKLIENVANEPYTNVSGGELMRQMHENAKTYEVLFRGFSNVFDAWEDYSGGEGQPFDLSMTPFRLTAIVNRIDMRSEKDAGELRFIYSAHSLNTCDASNGVARQGDERSLNMIVEFTMPGRSMANKQAMAQRWHALAQHPLGSNEYNAALEQLTRSITDAGSNPYDRSNQSYLKRIRFNGENGRFSWSLTDFRLKRAGINKGQIMPLEMRQTPDSRYFISDEVGHFINNNEADILTGDYNIDRHINLGSQRRYFRTKRAVGINGNTFEFTTSNLFNGTDTVPVNNLRARYIFSQNTCTGCHGKDGSQTREMVDTERGTGREARVAAFIKGGIDVTDPVDSSVIRHFNEFERRAADLDGLLQGPLSVIIDALNAEEPTLH